MSNVHHSIVWPFSHTHLLTFSATTRNPSNSFSQSDTLRTSGIVVADFSTLRFHHIDAK